MKKNTGADRNKTKQWRQATQLVRGGIRRSGFDETSEALYLTSGYSYDVAEDAEARFDGQDKGFTYSRLSNPTVAMFEERMALIEGAQACRATATGMAAMTAALLCQLEQGDHVVAAQALFGSCRWLVDSLLPKFGIQTTVVDGGDVDAWRSAVTPKTKVFFFETPANPTLDIVDIAALADIAKQHGIKLVVDNVFATPILQKPLELGADIIAYSATKHIDGQGRVLGGCVLGEESFIEETLLAFTRNTGPTLSPFNAWVLLKGLETLDLRVRRMAENAATVADHLQARGVNVMYPGLESHPQYALNAQQMETGGTIMSLFLGGGRETSFGFLNALELIDISNNIGDSRSLCTHPSSTTHYGVAADARLKMGITEDMVRLSIGLEDPADLIEDLDQALNAIARA